MEIYIRSMNLLREKCFDPPKMWHVAQTKPNPVNFPLDTVTPLFLLKLRSKERVYFVRVTIKNNIIGIFFAHCSVWQEKQYPYSFTRRQKLPSSWIFFRFPQTGKHKTCY